MTTKAEYDAIMAEQDAKLPVHRAWLAEKGYAEAWTTGEATALFEFEYFLMGFAAVVRKSDGAKGWLSLSDGPGYKTGDLSPRLYFNWRERS